MNIESNDNSKDLEEIGNFVIEQIRSVVPGEVGDDVQLDTSLHEFGLDSLASMAVVNRIEESLGIRFSEQSLYDIQTCRDLADIVQESLADKAPVSPRDL